MNKPPKPQQTSYRPSTSLDVRCAQSAPDPAPAQTPTEFANHTADMAAEINSSLQTLRQRIFGDQQPPNDETGPVCVERPSSLESSIQLTHFRLNEAIEQLTAIHNRL